MDEQDMDRIQPPLALGVDVGGTSTKAGLVDVAVAVPSGNTQHIQESHLSIEHIICELVEHHLFAEAKAK